MAHAFPRFILIRFCFEETPITKKQPPEAKPVPRSPTASPLLPGESSLKKKNLQLLVYTETAELGGEMRIFSAPKLLLKQKAVALLVFHAALFIFKEELNLASSRNGHSVCF